jgi:hypothetical protein
VLSISVHCVPLCRRPLCVHTGLRAATDPDSGELHLVESPHHPPRGRREEAPSGLDGPFGAMFSRSGAPGGAGRAPAAPAPAASAPGGSGPAAGSQRPQTLRGAPEVRFTKVPAVDCEPGLAVSSLAEGQTVAWRVVGTTGCLLPSRWVSLWASRTMMLPSALCGTPKTLE